jgi:rubrerythrin
MATKEFFHRLLDYERRVGSLYLTLGNRSTFSEELRAFWHRMAEDERRHVLVLQRSTTVHDLQESTPVGSDDLFHDIEQQLAAAEAILGQIDIGVDEALRHAMLLESSELNRLSDAWFRSFPPALRTLLTALMPEDNVHLRHLLEAVHAFSSNEALHEQAIALWVKYQRIKAESKSTEEKTHLPRCKPQS